jgi:DNA-binding LytR/AlgR family response regulator
MISCIIVDDEQPALSILENYINRIPELKLCGKFTNPLLAIEKLKTIKIDLIFLDIQMGKINGIEFVKHIDKNIKIIFCTAYSEFAIDGFELDAVDYLMKPISFNRFEKAYHRFTRLMNRGINDNLNLQIEDYIFVKAGRKGVVQKVDLIDIFFIESQRNYVSFQLKDKKILSYLSMKELEDKLSNKYFMRVHKSFIVSLSKIIALENSELKLRNNISIPLSLSYRNKFLENQKDKLIIH